ncbi:hypothetical protein HYV64_05600 [Candidatus Shapirobacteria bacterium]|nr:hypothetical protein [Candidatus Shapirobacteria bacterium]
MTSQRKRFLAPLVVIFLLTSVFWVFFKIPIYQYIFLILGLGLGAFFLDFDHIVYWLYLNPNVEESRLARLAIFKYDIRSVIKLIDATENQHTSLIFHHFFFQVVISIISVFVFTSSDNIFAKAFLLAINIHLLSHEFYDFKHRKQHLQDWLFARESKQLPTAYLDKYIAIFSILSGIFFILLLRSAT